MVGGQEDMIVDVALDLSEGNHRFGSDFATPSGLTAVRPGFHTISPLMAS